MSWDRKFEFPVPGMNTLRDAANDKRQTKKQCEALHIEKSARELIPSRPSQKGRRPMLDPEQFNSENERIWWPAILAMLAVQMIVLIALSIAVANHSSFATSSSAETKVNSLKR
jgi:hypothetical protein